MNTLARPIVLLHGWGLSSKVWAPLQAELPAATALDLPGHGSALPAGDSLAAWADALVDQLPDGRLSVFKDCGHAPLLSRPADCAALIAAFATEATAASATTAADH